ncbi:hypothetical protein ABWK46_19625 [Peribacillus frigoritolerans]|nr:hypothetical protein [Peribacillus frigoritolerans]MED4687405.1 hypothetical protein [Peribacillus frigoritolerans]
MELITVTEYYGNSFVSERLANYIGPGQIEYIPEKEVEGEGEIE